MLDAAVVRKSRTGRRTGRRSRHQRTWHPGDERIEEFDFDANSPLGPTSLASP